MLTGTETMPVTLLASMMVVTGVSAKWCENAAIDGVRIANSLMQQNKASMPMMFSFESFTSDAISLPILPSSGT